MSKVADSDLYSKTSENFIPVACHYDQNTLVTKNGELLQTIEIQGLNAKNINTDLVSLRQTVRAAILDSITNKDYAVWVHTIRRRANLDDDADYYGFLSANIHDIWSRKNFWKDKFVNKLYITIVHKAQNTNVTNMNVFLKSLTFKKIINSDKQYLQESLKKLNATCDKMLANLESYGARRLSLEVREDKTYSELMFLYRRIMHLKEEECLLPSVDISSFLSSHQYALGNDKIEVTGEGQKKFAAIMSIKEYQDVPSLTLNKFMQIPVEMVVTEVFYYIDKKEIAEDFKDQQDILNITKNDDLIHWKNFDKLNSTLKKDRYCHQQISFMVIGDNQKILDSQLAQASQALSNIGVVHVREDIGLEKAFWAQLPGNFSCLSRIKPAPVSSAAAMTSLHNYPTGNKYNPWGRALTLLRGEQGAPYFMNFHDAEDDSSCCVFGDSESGKTVLTNFLLSEADKYNPTTLYLTDSIDSGLYVKARGGRWFQRSKNIINPLICKDTKANREYLFEFFKIITKHYFDVLSDAELEVLRDISDAVFELPDEKRILSDIIKNIKGSEITEKIKTRLADYTQEGRYHKLFEPEEIIQIKKGDLLAVSLQDFDDAAFREENYPKEKKYIEQYEYDLNTMRSVKASIILALQNKLRALTKDPKILAVDNLHNLCNLEFFSHLPDLFSKNMNKHNGVALFNVNTNTIDETLKKEIKQSWIKKMKTKIIMSSNISVEGFDKMLNIDQNDMEKLQNFKAGYYQFILNQDGKTIATELSIGALPGLLKILVSNDYDLAIYKEIMDQKGESAPEEWVEELYEKLGASI